MVNQAVCKPGSKQVNHHKNESAVLSVIFPVFSKYYYIF